MRKLGDTCRSPCRLHVVARTLHNDLLQVSSSVVIQLERQTNNGGESEAIVKTIDSVWVLLGSIMLWGRPACPCLACKDIFSWLSGDDSGKICLSWWKSFCRIMHKIVICLDGKIFSEDWVIRKVICIIRARFHHVKTVPVVQTDGNAGGGMRQRAAGFHCGQNHPLRSFVVKSSRSLATGEVFVISQLLPFANNSAKYEISLQKIALLKWKGQRFPKNKSRRWRESIILLRTKEAWQ